MKDLGDKSWLKEGGCKRQDLCTNFTVNNPKKEPIDRLQITWTVCKRKTNAFVKDFQICVLEKNKQVFRPFQVWDQSGEIFRRPTPSMFFPSLQLVAWFPQATSFCNPMASVLNLEVMPNHPPTETTPLGPQTSLQRTQGKKKKKCNRPI